MTLNRADGVHAEGRWLPAGPDTAEPQRVDAAAAVRRARARHGGRRRARL